MPLRRQIALVAAACVAAGAEAFSYHQGYLSGEDDLFQSRVSTLAEAERLCAEADECAGFTFEGGPEIPPEAQTVVYFKRQWKLESSGATSAGWASYSKAPAQQASPLPPVADAPAQQASPLPPVADVEFFHYQGYLEGGDDLFESKVSTLAEAKQLCAEAEKCVGFTFEGPEIPPEAPTTVYFKQRWKLEPRGKHWTSYSNGLAPPPLAAVPERCPMGTTEEDCISAIKSQSFKDTENPLFTRSAALRFALALLASTMTRHAVDI